MQITIKYKNKFYFVLNPSDPYILCNDTSNLTHDNTIILIIRNSPLSNSY